MAKKESTFFNMVSTLFVIALISSVSVGSVYEITKAPIAQAQLEKKTNAIQQVVPEFDNNPINEGSTVQTGNGFFYLYPAMNNGVLVGTAVEAFSNNGFGGEVKVMVGFLPDGSIHDIAVIQHKETPGLGDKIDPSKSNFLKQFQGKHAMNFRVRVKKDGGDVDAITAATISSRAFCDAVQQAYQAYQEGSIK